MANTKSPNNLSRDELLTFLDSYRNVIELNSYVLESVKDISKIVKEINESIINSNHKSEMTFQDVLHKFENILSALQILNTNFDTISSDDIPNLKAKLESDIKELKTISEKIILTNSKEHSALQLRINVGWITLSTFFVTVVGSLITLIVTYYKEIQLLKKLIEHFGIK